MFKVFVNTTILAVFLICQSCSNPIPEIKITDVSFKMESVSEDVFAELQIFNEKADKAIKKLEENKAYKAANIVVESEFSSEEASSSTLQLSFQFDQTMSSTKEELNTIGKEAFQVVLNVLEPSTPYDNYEIKFLQYANADSENPNNFRAYTYTNNDFQ